MADGGVSDEDGNLIPESYVEPYRSIDSEYECSWVSEPPRSAFGGE